MKVKIKAYHALATWKWDLPDDADDTCGICRVNFEGTCSKCKYPGGDCPISTYLSRSLPSSSRRPQAFFPLLILLSKTVIGQCTHCFHIHCIANWLESEASLGKCPMCRQKFQEKLAAPVTPAAAANRPSLSGRNTTNLGSSLIDSSGVAVTPDVPVARTPATGGRMTRSATGAAGAARNLYAQSGRTTPASATRHR
jgi:anaphase-promoting complex subunit 11